MAAYLTVADALLLYDVDGIGCRLTADVVEQRLICYQQT